MLREFCRVYWGSHGCQFKRGHDLAVQPHECDCCECDGPCKAECVAKPPYYGPQTNFYGEDATAETVGQWGRVLT